MQSECRYVAVHRSRLSELSSCEESGYIVFFLLPRESEMLIKWLMVVKNEMYAVNSKYEAVKHLRVCGLQTSTVPDECRLTK